MLARHSARQRHPKKGKKPLRHDMLGEMLEPQGAACGSHVYVGLVGFLKTLEKTFRSMPWQLRTEHHKQLELHSLDESSRNGCTVIRGL